MFLSYQLFHLLAEAAELDPERPLGKEDRADEAERAGRHRDQVATPAPVQVDAQAAPDIAWVGWLGAAVSPDTAPARPYYLRAPDAKPQKDMLQKAAQPSAP